MNGINNQLINPAIAQNLNAVDKGSEEKQQQLIQFIQQKQIKPRSASFPLVSEKFHPARGLGRKWTKEEDEKFIELKQQEPKLKWTDIAKYFPEVTGEQCRSHWKNKLKPLKPNPSVKYQKWTTEEDEQLIKLKQQQEPKLTWADIAKYFPSRTDRQCQAHWHRTLAPNSSIRYQKYQKLWTQEEDEQLIKLKQQQEPKLKWTDIAKYFPRRTDRQCQAHWSRKRKLIEEENNDERASKKLRTQHSDSSPELPLTQEDLSLTEEEL